MTNARRINNFTVPVVDVSKFRTELKRRYPDSVLLKVLEAEPDRMDSEEFLVKLPTWLKLSREAESL
jgi:hypothetical protein